MTTIIKTLAIAGLMGSISVPAFAAAHMSASMTCAEFNALSAQDQITVAQMAIAEVSSGADGMSLRSESMAVESTGGTTTAAEATDGTSVQGSLLSGESMAVEPTGGNTEASNSTAVEMSVADLRAFMVVCDQRLDAMVSEAAAGLTGGR